MIQQFLVYSEAFHLYDQFQNHLTLETTDPLEVPIQDLSNKWNETVWPMSLALFLHPQFIFIAKQSSIIWTHHIFVYH